MKKLVIAASLILSVSCGRSKTQADPPTEPDIEQTETENGEETPSNTPTDQGNVVLDGGQGAILRDSNKPDWDKLGTDAPSDGLSKIDITSVTVQSSFQQQSLSALLNTLGKSKAVIQTLDVNDGSLCMGCLGSAKQLAGDVKSFDPDSTYVIVISSQTGTPSQFESDVKNEMQGSATVVIDINGMFARAIGSGLHGPPTAVMNHQGVGRVVDFHQGGKELVVPTLGLL